MLPFQGLICNCECQGQAAFIESNLISGFGAVINKRYLSVGPLNNGHCNGNHNRPDKLPILSSLAIVTGQFQEDTIFKYF